MLRTILTFVAGAILGAIAGGSAVFVVAMRTNVHAPVRTMSRAAPAVASATPKPEAQQLAEKIGSAATPAEQSLAAEPDSKPVPALAQPAALSDDAIVIPVAGVHRGELRDDFHEARGGREHRALDIPAPRGTPVVAAIDGPVAKLFLSKPGGITLYEFDPSKQWIYYYAHLDGYAPGIVEGKELKRGEVIGFVGTSGNAPPNAPHLHFSIEKLATPGVWWKSDPIDPFPLLEGRGVTIERMK